MQPVQNQQEKPQTKEISVIDDCNTETLTVVLNDVLIVDGKYDGVHHDAEDVQENSTSFLDETNTESEVLCEAETCDNNGQTAQQSSQQ